MNGPVEAFIGVKISAVVAGVIGGIVSLSFIQNLTPWKAFIAIVTGAASAAYLTPLVVTWFSFGAEVEHAVAFFSGLLGMNLLAGFFKLSERFRERPLDTIRDVKNLKGRDDGG